MAPELFQEGGVYSFASDFWSLGCVLYELATGKPPFSANGLKELINEILGSSFEKVEGFTTQNALVLIYVNGKHVKIKVLNPDTLDFILEKQLR